MKKIICFLLCAYLLLIAWGVPSAHGENPASAESNSSGGFRFSMPDMPDLQDFDSENWLSGMTLPDGWLDFSMEGFGQFPDGWSDMNRSMDEWNERFNSFRDQVISPVQPSSSDSSASGSLDKLKEAFASSHADSPEAAGTAADIRDLIPSFFGASDPQTSDSTDIPVLKDLFGKQNHDSASLGASSADRQLSAIAAAVGITGKNALPQDSVSLPAESLGTLPIAVSSREAGSGGIAKLFDQYAQSLATGMDVAPDRYKSLYSGGKADQKTDSAASMSALKSLYASLKKE